MLIHERTPFGYTGRMTTAPRGRRPLSVSGIVAAARKIADTEGLDELTLRRLARELGTGQASLYRHIADRDELLALLVEDLGGGYPVISDTGLSSREEAIAQWTAIDHYLGRHPWFAVLLAAGRARTTAALPVADNCLRQLRGVALDDDEALRAYRALWHLLIGTNLNAHPFGYFHGARAESRDIAWAVGTLIDGMVVRRESAARA